MFRTKPPLPERLRNLTVCRSRGQQQLHEEQAAVALRSGGLLRNMDSEHIVVIGNRTVWGGEKPFGLRRADRRHHVYAIGKTGSGKTTLLRNLILQDIAAGEGVAVVDPHGDLAQELLDHIPRSRTDDVVYFNPADHEHPIGFNLLQSVAPERRHLVASGVVSAFRSIWRDSWGPRLEYILYAAVAALLECENVTLLGVQRILVDPRYRRWALKQVKDPVVRSFWLDEFENYDARFMREAIAPIQNKVGQLLMAPPVRNIFGQVRSRIDPRFMMDNRRLPVVRVRPLITFGGGWPDAKQLCRELGPGEQRRRARFP